VGDHSVGGGCGVGGEAEEVAGGAVGEPAQPDVPDPGERAGAVVVSWPRVGVEEGGREPGDVAGIANPVANRDMTPINAPGRQ
jgi:hypothetical protein